MSLWWDFFIDVCEGKFPIFFSLTSFSDNVLLQLIYSSLKTSVSVFAWFSAPSRWDVWFQCYPLSPLRAAHTLFWMTISEWPECWLPQAGDSPTFLFLYLKRKHLHCLLYITFLMINFFVVCGLGKYNHIYWYWIWFCVFMGTIPYILPHLRLFTLSCDLFRLIYLLTY